MAIGKVNVLAIFGFAAGHRADTLTWRLLLCPIWEHATLSGVRVIARSTLLRFIGKLEGHKEQPAVKAALESWYQEARRAEWKNSSEVKASYAHVSIVSADRAVFNIKGNAYRLVVAIDYRRGIVFIKWVCI